MDSKNQKLSIFVTAKVRAELEREAKRLDRPISWILMKAWKLSRGRILSRPDETADELDTVPPGAHADEHELVRSAG